MKLKLLSYSKDYTGLITIDLCICKNDKVKEYRYIINSEYILKMFLLKLKYKSYGRALSLLKRWNIK
jgi:hypothetical protein